MSTRQKHSSLQNAERESVTAAYLRAAEQGCPTMTFTRAALIGKPSNDRGSPGS